MPELPEVETTLRGIAQHIEGRSVAALTVRQPKLRLPVPPGLHDTLCGQTVRRCRRRAKYLLIEFPAGIVLIHLGMSGSLRVFRPDTAPAAGRHDHLDIVFSDGLILRYRDPRRFGMVLWYAGAPETHPLLAHLGPEPLADDFDAGYLFAALQKRRSAVKSVLMDNRVVVGVGNIYANESLFYAGIAPHRPACDVSENEAAALCTQIKTVLARAIAKGGSTLRDFVDSSGNSGYFQQEYAVYGRHQLPCPRCGTPVAKQIIGQRSSFYCPACQT
ncbi:bifunctional DNA-formamidopyrimidine glycosylase/DNA-(apurinic or apyrimidinic site) lyase [Neisseria leonii]|uniref:bifunctional DNA-formamidopyrimidine glycosylase/DNA-(apurinic or apyrimidinic site) lyase n=1 Tax=Neisseria leonii TaxID=2995413 RepID=UPI00237AB711|nr:bifunctional DNA-formamidopyrimidine glycosylase/DNA-(apurinic or apyrimidinic site) lyase [Neisseria sp. 3986]MDD9324999.1 bifunctional DNA-formamidopyrimidine glycosylase/DNA-(apurinic or apyrimidinic site) lyase [Neisseria sp. 3986]